MRRLTKKNSMYSKIVDVKSSNYYVLRPTQTDCEIECPFDKDTSIFEENGVFVIKKKSFIYPFKK